MEPTLRQLQAFVLSYRFGALTRAAEQMFVTQSAVSVLIQQLEEALGIRLFDRTTRAVRPTVAAHDLLPTAERMLRDLNALKAGARGIAQRTRGHLNFASTPAVAAALLPRLISEYQRRYPDIRVSMYDSPPDQLITQVLQEEVEFSIGTIGTPPEGITLRPLLQDYLSVICTTDSPLAKKRQVRWSDVFPLRCITVREGSGIRDLVDSAARQLGIAFDPAFEVAYMSSALSMASAGLGVALLPSALLDSFAYKNLVARPLQQPVVTRDINLICLAHRSLSPAAEGFIELWQERIGKGDRSAAET
jgi:DNA-binding transcriptional LysR family regulator